MAREIGRMVILLGGGFLVLLLGWWDMFFVAAWAGSDRVMEYKGQTAVEEEGWMDWHYYEYHGPLVRGKEAVGHSWEDYHKRREAEEKDRAEKQARKKAGRALGLDIPDSGEVQCRDDTHGGFHNDGETYIQIRFNEDSGAVLEQIEASKWLILWMGSKNDCAP